jgi:hypothetical protein
MLTINIVWEAFGIAIVSSLIVWLETIQELDAGGHEINGGLSNAAGRVDIR